MDPKVNGQYQPYWSWLIAAYLFLGGVAGGAYTIGAINNFIGTELALSTTVALWIAFPAIVIGCLMLIADLGTPAKAVLAGLKPGTSWISRGTWIIFIFMIISFIHLMLAQFSGFGESESGAQTLRILSIFGILFAVGTMAYTGILLGASKGIPFWRSGIVPVVFVISAIVTGHFAIMLGLVAFKSSAVPAELLRTMSLEAVVLVVVELLAILFFLQAAFRQPDSRESAERILRNGLFVVGYFILGLATPAILMLIVYKTGSGGPGLLAVGSALGLLGGLVLRQSVLVFGALPTWNIAGFKFRRIHRPKVRKPDIGMLPPQ